MRKYIAIFKFELMNSIQYVFNSFSRVAMHVLQIFIFTSLWSYIYSDPSNVINGYSYNQMIWYIIFGNTLRMITAGRTLTEDISEEVINGGIATKLTKPYNFINYQLASTAGKSITKFFIFTIVGLVFGYIFVGSFPELTVWSVIIVLISSIIAAILDNLMSIIIGLFSFVIEDSSPIYWVYSKFLMIFGQTFPIEFFPGIIGTIMYLSPILAIKYGPAKLFVDFSWKAALIILIIQVFYLIVIYLLAQLIYKKGVKKLNVNGG